MEFLFGVFTGAVMFPAVLLSLSWWAFVLVVVFLIITEWMVYQEEDVWAFFFLFIVFVFTSYMLSDAEGLRSTLWAVTKGTVLSLIQYIILGLIAVVPLWLREVRKHNVKLRDELNQYIYNMGNHDKDGDPRYGELLTDDEREICLKYQSGEEIPDFLKERWKKFRKEYLSSSSRGMKFMDNLDKVSSFIFLWPFHILTLIFGDLLAQIPIWFARTFGRLIDQFARRITRFGIPEGIDED